MGQIRGRYILAILAIIGPSTGPVSSVTSHDRMEVVIEAGRGSGPDRLPGARAIRYPLLREQGVGEAVQPPPGAVQAVSPRM